MNRIFAVVIASLLYFNAGFAQTDTGSSDKSIRKIIKHLDLGVTLGTEGIGLDVAVPVVDNLVNVRAGFTYMPRFDATMHFGFEAGDETMNQEERDQQFDKLSNMLYDMDSSSRPILCNPFIMRSRCCVRAFLSPLA